MVETLTILKFLLLVLQVTFSVGQPTDIWAGIVAITWNNADLMKRDVGNNFTLHDVAKPTELTCSGEFEEVYDWNQLLFSVLVTDPDQIAYYTNFPSDELECLWWFAYLRLGDVNEALYVLKTTVGVNGSNSTLPAVENICGNNVGSKAYVDSASHEGIVSGNETNSQYVGNGTIEVDDSDDKQSSSVIFGDVY